jgi:hypothetical protein
MTVTPASLVVLVALLLSCTYPPLDAGPADAAVADAAILDAAVVDAAVADAAILDGQFGGGDSLPDSGPPDLCGAAVTQLDLTAAVSSLELAVGSGGDAIVAWWDQGRLTVAESFATGDTWSRSGLEFSRGGTAFLTIAVGRRGDALAATAITEIDARRRSESGKWVTFRNRDHFAVPDVRAAIDDAGNMLLAWVSFEGPEGATVRAERFVAAEGQWTASAALSVAETTIEPPQLAMNSRGDAVVAWRENADQTDRLIARRFSAATGAWDAPHEIDRALAISEPAIAFENQGDLVVSWNEHRDGHNNLRAARFSMHEGWSTAHVVASDVGHLDPPILIAGSGGVATVLWRQEDSPDVWASRSLGHDWTDPAVVLSRDSGAGGLRVAADEHGSAVAAWSVCDGSECRVEAARLDTSDGTWRRGPALYESASAQSYLDLAVGASETRALVAWRPASPMAICVARIW